MTAEHKNIDEAINAVMAEVGYVKKQKSDQLKYTYLGEAGLIEALRPSMVEHGIYVSVRRVIKIYRDQYQTKSGTNMTSTVIHGVVRFSHVSGSHVDVEATGEGADSGDKSANKAMTGLYKYAMRQTFCIETGDDPDQFASEAQERALKPQAKSTTSTGSRESDEKQGVGATQDEKTTQTTSKQSGASGGQSGASDEAKKLAEGFTGNQILAKTDLVKELVTLTGRDTVEVCRFVGTLEKGKKFTLGQIKNMMVGGENVTT
jgi:hypothetical protein